MSDKAEQIRALQDQAKADGFQRLPDEKAFMDELSGEDAGITFRNRFTMLDDQQLERAALWWAELSAADQMRRREHAVKVRAGFGIFLPEEGEEWPAGEGWAAVCYDDENA